MDILFTPGRGGPAGIVFACLWLGLLAPTNGPAQVNKCVINGRTVYTDSDCPQDGASRLRLKPLNLSSTGSPADEPAEGVKSNYSSSTWFRDHAGYARALKVSREQNAPIFIYAYTDWCGYCKKLDRDMLPDSRVRKALSGYVKVRLNPEHSDADKRLFKKWGGTGYPTLLIQTAYDSPPARTRGPFKKENGKWKLMPRDAFIGMLESRLE